MRKPLFLFVGALCLVNFANLGNKEIQFKSINGNVPKSATLKVDTDYGKMPLYFIPNHGQMDKQVAYYVQGKDKTLYFAADGITFALTTAGPKEARPSVAGMAGSFQDGRVDKIKSREGVLEGAEACAERGLEGRPERWVVKLEFVGANKQVKPIGEAETGAVVSYFKGRPEEWRTGLPTYSRIVYPNLWTGIDLVYRGTVNRLKYEFIVHPGADPSKIRLAYQGAEKVSLDADGRLQVETPSGAFSDDVPVAYQEVEGKKNTVALAYKVEASGAAPKNERTFEEEATSVHIYSFKIDAYDHSQTLVLDPAILVYCGYIGGSDWDSGSEIAVDSSGNAYITGYTRSTETTFPVTVGPDLTFNAGTGDAFVAKVNAAGTSLVYCGFIGGSDYDIGEAIAVDASGNAYLAGATSSTEATFPVTIGPDLTFNGIQDVFVAKVNAAGTALVYCGYIGGLDEEGPRGVAVDGQGTAYIVGATSSTETTFPVTVGPDLTYSGYYDAFVARVNAAGTALVYCGYIGGSSNDGGTGIAVDSSGNAYVIGDTRSTETTFPVTVGPDLTFNGNPNNQDIDAFVAKVNAAGTALVYCGYIGGSSDDFGYGIAVDRAGSVYVTGDTMSTEATFPVAVGPDLTSNGGGEAFVAKINAAGTALVYCGYIGGGSTDSGRGIALDASGNAYVAGYTSSPEATFPVTVGPDLSYNGGYNDAFVAEVNAEGTALVYCGYIGGSGDDYGLAIAVDEWRNAYVIGDTYSIEPIFPVTVGPDLTFNGDPWDAFVAKVSYYGPGDPHMRAPINSMDFGNVNVGNHFNQATTIYNDGAGALIISGVVRTSGSAEFTYLSPSPPFSVSPGGSQTITARFSPTSPGAESAQFTVSSNDPEEPSVTFNVSGTGVFISGPDIDLPSAVLDFGDVQVNFSEDFGLLIQNLGNAALSINSITRTAGSSDFSVVSFPSSIPIGGSGYAIVRLSPLTPGEKNAGFDINSNDPDEADVIFTAAGRGVALCDNSPSNYKILPEAIWAPATGGGTWVSEVQVTDLTGGSAVSAYFSYGGGGRRGPFTLWTNSAGANSSIKSANILLTIQSLDSGFGYYGRVGTAEFLTQDSSHKIQVAARTLNGDYSKTLPGFNLTESNTADTTRKMMIQNYINNATYRSTCGFFNPTADSVTVEFRLMNNSGNLIGSAFTKIFVGYDFKAFSPFNEAGVPYPAYSYDNVFLLVDPTSGTGKLVCFGASANNNTNDPAAHIAVQYQGALDNSPSAYQILPEAIWAPATGGGTWVSEVQITDLNGGSVVKAYFSYGGGGRRGPIILWTNSGGANRSGKFANILSSMQSLDSGFVYYGRVGTVEFLTQDASHNIQVVARTLNGNYSKTLPAFNLADSSTADTIRKMMIQNYTNNATYRSTCGFFNPTANSLTVEFRLMNSNGNLIGSAFTKTFVGYDFKAFSPFNEASVPYPTYSYDNVFLQVNPTSGVGKLVCFGASANNTTNDPAAHIAVQCQ